MSSRGSSLILPSSVLAAAVLAAPALRADTLVMQDGRRIHGHLVSVSRGWVEFEPLPGEDTVDEIRVAVAEVRAVQFDDARRRSDLGPGRDGGRMDRADDEPVLSPRERQGRRGDVVPARDPIGPRRGRMITVDASQRWTDTAVDVTAGDIVSFSVAGTVTLGDDRPLGPEGDVDGAAPAPRRPMADRPAGALIGRIGTSPDDTFFIGGERLPFRVRTSGRLFLGINDDTLGDDGGAFQVSISR